MTDMLNTKKDKPIDKRTKKAPDPSVVVPSEMSRRYSWKGQPAHKVKPTQSCYSQHQRQVQPGHPHSEPAALIPPTTRSLSCEEDRGRLDVQILIKWIRL